ncbi:MAG: hypothetical protein JETT_3125 [Candidatus Jettenia ecosi]|uniref:Uncharacterized protein n=1 Tax=Candidatus Jettenia ecosi TaxID=2494326 RepID=A0A533Q7L5_9BACT|nr:MAG: hypothetical protein JETT_3125 [Candidatus Jettenia ecosi]
MSGKLEGWHSNLGSWSQLGKTEIYQLPETLDLIGWGTRIRT